MTASAGAAGATGDGQDTAGFVLGVDLDGVCGDHATAFRTVVAAEWNRDPGSLPPQLTWNFEEWGLTDETFEQLHRRAILVHGMFRTMPPVEGVAESLWRLSDAGVWIRIITHRLYANWGHAVAVRDTVAWLDEVNIPYRDICFLGQKPEVEADAYVDDAPHNIVELRRAGNTVIIFDQPYNRHLEGPRALDWVGVERLVGEVRLARGQALQERLSLGDDPADRLRRLPPEGRGTTFRPGPAGA